MSKKKLFQTILCVVLTTMIICGSAFAATIYSGSVKKTTALYNSKMKAIGTLSKGERVLCRAVSTGSGVVSVMSEKGSVGYAAASALKYRKSFDTHRFALTRRSVQMYRIVGGRPYAAGTVRKNVPMYIIAQSSGYAKVRALNGVTGFVKASSLRHF